jgi:hypothetical protein
MCHIGKAYSGREYSVVLHLPSERYCPPLFFLNENSRQRLDLKAFRDIIDYNSIGYWHFREGVDILDTEYGFAFEDYYIDPNGFIHEKIGR